MLGGVYMKIKECKKIMKKCSKCGEVKHIKNFSKQKRNRDGYNGVCKQCNKKRYKLICEYCGEEFYTENKKQKYCSKKCSPANRKGEDSIFYKQKDYNCDYCGKKIKIENYTFDKYNYHYCCRKCQDLHHSELITGDKNSNWVGRIKTNCDFCGKELELTPKKFNEHKKHFCNKKCFDKWFKDNFKGEKHPNYKPSITDEQRAGRRNGMETWKKRVVKKYNNKCVICNSKEELEAHHLDGYNWCVEKRKDLENGVCLCHTCHRKFHSMFGVGNNTIEQFKEFLKMLNIIK